MRYAHTGLASLGVALYSVSSYKLAIGTLLIGFKDPASPRRKNLPVQLTGRKPGFFCLFFVPIYQL